MTAPFITPFSVSVYTSPRPLGKRIARLTDGTVKKVSLGSIVEGTVDSLQLNQLSDFAALRCGLASSQALGYGATGYPSARVVTRAALAAILGAERVKDGTPVVARDAAHLHFPDGPGVLMLDHDPAIDATAMGADELRRALCQAMPELCGVSMFWTPSAGSMIYAGDDEVVGLRGSRMYFVVSDARRIPEVGELLFDRLTLAGHGRIAISGSGRLLRRGPIDSSVWQPERLDYVRATCGPGLEQRPSGSKLFSGDGVDRMIGETMLDVDTLQQLTSDEEATLAAVWAKLCADAKPDADRARHTWAVARAHADAAKPDAQIDDFTARVVKYEASARTLELDGDHLLKLADGRELTVAELRADAKRFDGVRMADPFEPEYGGNDHRIAVAYLLREGGSDPAIFSHAHGGAWYSLLRPGEAFEGFDDDGDSPGHATSQAAGGTRPTSGSSAAPQRSASGGATPNGRPRAFAAGDYPAIALAFWRDAFDGPDDSRLRRWRGAWYEYTGTHYRELDRESLTAKVHTYLVGSRKRLQSGDVPFKPKRRDVEETLVALLSLTLLSIDNAPAMTEDAQRNAALVRHSPRDIISLTNGLFHLPSRTLLPHTPAFFTLNALPYRFDPAALCPEWHGFLRALWPQDAQSREVLQELIGYLLTSETGQQKIGYIVGPRRSGKGTILRIVSALVGPENVVSPTLNSLTTQFGLAPLIGKLVAVIGDARAGGRYTQTTIERLLSISGEDSISVDRKNRDAWDGQLTTRFVIASNDLLTLPDSSGALAGRMLLLRLTRTFYGQEDQGLFGRLRMELPGIFNWALLGLDRLHRRGYFQPPDASRAALEQLNELNSPIATFVEQCCELGPDLRADKDDLYEAYRTFRSDEGLSAESKAIFAKNLYSAFPKLEQFKGRSGAARTRELAGIALREGAPASPLNRFGRVF